MKIHIYKIYFPTSKKCYIGQTKDIKERIPKHLKSDSLVCKALWKYDDWVIEILHTTKDKDIANLLEIEEIRHYNCVVPKGYNLSRGGEGGASGCNWKWPEESKKKAKGNQNAKGFKHTDEWKKNKSKSQIGMHHSEESKEKMRLAKLGKKRKPLSVEHKAKISKSLIGNQRAKGVKHSKTYKLKMQIALRKHFIKKLENENPDLFYND